MAERGCQSVGIDLGTTYSSLAYMDSQMTPRVVADGSGQTVLPSVVFFDDHEIIVGDIALQQAKLRADRVVQFVKVHMGDEWRREINGHTHTPESISAIILSQLVRDAEPQIGSIPSAVITVPAYFTEKRRRATQQAGEIAGLEVIGTLNEPMAAALAHGLYRESKEQIAVVYDLGGGTFDVTIVRITPNELEELATTGNRQLGGKDWDQSLIDFVAEDFQKKHKNDPRTSPQAVQDLLLECEQAKRRLGRMAKTSVRLHAFGHDHAVEVTREKFESVTAHLVQTTKLTTELALEDAGLEWKDISRVVLVGGSTHMPAVRAMLKEASGMQPDTGVNPVTAVSLGAAIYAHMLETGKAPKAIHQRECVEPESLTAPPAGPATQPEPPQAISGALPRVRFVTAHGVGVKALSKDEWINAVLIRKNTQVPCSVTQRFFSLKAKGHHTRVKLIVTQGDTPHLDLAEILGAGSIEGLPANEPGRQPIEINMKFDEQGRLHLHAVYVNTGQALKLSLDIPGGLLEEQVREHRQFLEETGLVSGVIRRDDSNPLMEFDDDEDDEVVPLF